MGQTLHLSSPARAYLDNLRPSRARGGRVVRMLAYARRFTAAVDWAGLPETAEELRTCHAFEEEASAEEKGVRLQFSGPTPAYHSRA